MGCVKEHLFYITGAITLGMFGMYLILPEDAKKSAKSALQKCLKKKEKIMLDAIE